MSFPFPDYAVLSGGFFLFGTSHHETNCFHVFSSVFRGYFEMTSYPKAKNGLWFKQQTGETTFSYFAVD